MVYTQRLKYDTIRSIDSSTFTGSFQALGTPLSFPGAIVKLVNNSSVLVTISTDGVNTHDVAPAGSFWLYDCVSNAPPQKDPIFIPSGTQYLVNGASGTGLVYLVVQYILQF